MSDPSDGGLPVKPAARRVILAIVGAAVVALCAYVNFQLLDEAFGAGPPYFARTTNMDKWVNPVPGLLVLDGVAVVLLWLLWRRLARAGRNREPGV